MKDEGELIPTLTADSGHIDDFAADLDAVAAFRDSRLSLSASAHTYMGAVKSRQLEKLGIADERMLPVMQLWGWQIVDDEIHAEFVFDGEGTVFKLTNSKPVAIRLEVIAAAERILDLPPFEDAMALLLVVEKIGRFEQLAELEEEHRVSVRVPHSKRMNRSKKASEFSARYKNLHLGGMTDADIKRQLAAEFKVSERTIGRWITSP